MTLSKQRIADALGVTQRTVGYWLKDVKSTFNVSMPETRTDTLGRKQPTKYASVAGSLNCSDVGTIYRGHTTQRQSDPPAEAV